MTEHTIDIEGIMKLIPHRYPLLLVDRIVEITPGERIVALKNVTMNEPHFNGHFPGKPIMPGVLIIEALAQASALMVIKGMIGDVMPLVYFMTIDNAKFRKPVVPGDALRLEVNAVQRRGNVWKCAGQAFVEDKKVAEAVFSAMIVEQEAK
jgi:3-hydroxyacyl-[acyl-carrier-protein] dehydratase